MENRALGLIEVYGYLGAIATADATLKAADVELVNAEKISGGLTTIQVMGDVGAVTAGVESGRVVAESLGCLLSSHVIARMDADTQALLIEKNK
nr:BMC domain-containing protein [Brochothrix thermosphacta]